jgi:acyl carrier protein
VLLQPITALKNCPDYTDHNMELQEVISKLKVQIIEQLNLEEVKPSDIDANAPLFGAGLGLDSIDALELIVLLEKNYGVKIQDPKEAKDIFTSIKTMADYVMAHGHIQA